MKKNKGISLSYSVSATEFDFQSDPKYQKILSSLAKDMSDEIDKQILNKIKTYSEMEMKKEAEPIIKKIKNDKNKAMLYMKHKNSYIREHCVKILMGNDKEKK